MKLQLPCLFLLAACICAVAIDSTLLKFEKGIDKRAAPFGTLTATLFAKFSYLFSIFNIKVLLSDTCGILRLAADMDGLTPEIRTALSSPITQCGTCPITFVQNGGFEFPNPISSTVSIPLSPPSPYGGWYQSQRYVETRPVGRGEFTSIGAQNIQDHRRAFHTTRKDASQTTRVDGVFWAYGIEQKVPSCLNKAFKLSLRIRTSGDGCNLAVVAASGETVLMSKEVQLSSRDWEEQVSYVIDPQGRTDALRINVITGCLRLKPDEDIYVDDVRLIPAP